MTGLLLASAGCRKCGNRSHEMIWDRPGPDGFELSYFKNETIGPTYVRRRLHPDFCEFGDFPDSGKMPVTRVECGETWQTTGGLFALRCDCAGHARLGD